MDARARHRHLMGLFDTLCELPSAARVAWLEAVRAEDPQLADTLERMLATEGEASPLDAPIEALLDDTPQLPARYRDLGRLGKGGMGEVRRVFDTELNRELAMKIIAPSALPFEDRFLAEAQVVAQLQHPSIVPIHALGRLPDGRCYFTMREVTGSTFAALLTARRDLTEGLRDHVYVLRQVAQAVAYAHDQGVVHRDLKPGNVMIGPFGDVMVLDWGLARRLEGSRLRLGAAGVVTAGGMVMGSPGYMAPEQAMGMRDLIGPPTDVFALGAILFCILCGRAPFGPTPDPLAALSGPPPVEGPGLPAALVDLCRHALAPQIDDRPPDAGAFAVALSDWLTGAADRARARAILDAAGPERGRFLALRAQAAEQRREAGQALALVPLHAPLGQKLPGWALEDAAAGLEEAAQGAEARWLQQVHTALNLAPDLIEAHAALADHHRDLAVAAAARGDATMAAVHQRAVARHDDGRYARWLAGTAHLTVTTTPPGAEVSLWRWHTEHRRRHPALVEALGQAPLSRDDVPAGDYLLRVRLAGHVTVDHPIRLAREGAATCHLPLPVALPEGTCYVPPGHSLIGGDPSAPDGFPAALVFVPGFVVGRFPVTNAEYLRFLDALVAEGREAEALEHAPREPMGESGAGVYGRDAAGRFCLGVDAEGVRWLPDAPVVQVSWRSAMAYCAWRAAQTGHPWRLLHEVEWEKAARGADGRAYPWGDHFDPAFACSLHSHVDPVRVRVDTFPTDQSPYGLRGLGGNVRDWCLNVWAAAPPEPVLAVTLPTGDALRATRGGSFSSLAPMCRAATRFAAPPDQRFGTVGFRVGFSWPEESSRSAPTR